MARTRGEEPELRLYLKYQADIWVVVDTEEHDILSVVVDDVTMTTPVDVVGGADGPVAGEGRIRAEMIAGRAIGRVGTIGPALRPRRCASAPSCRREPR